MSGPDSFHPPAPLEYARPGTMPRTRTSRLAIASFLVGVLGSPLVTAAVMGGWLERLLPEPRHALATVVRFYTLPLVGLLLGSCAVAVFRRHPPHLVGRQLALWAVALNLAWIVLGSCIGLGALLNTKMGLD